MTDPSKQCSKISVITCKMAAVPTGIYVAPNVRGSQSLCLQTANATDPILGRTAGEDDGWSTTCPSSDLNDILRRCSFEQAPW